MTRACCIRLLAALGAVAAAGVSAPSRAQPASVPAPSVMAQWSSRAENYWLYVLRGDGAAAACDWKEGDKATPAGVVECFNSLSLHGGVAPTAACALPSDGEQLVVPANSTNNSVARLNPVSGCVSICYLKATGGNTSFLCTEGQNPFSLKEG